MATPTLHIHPRVAETMGVVRYEFDLAYSDGPRACMVYYEVAGDAGNANFDGILCAVVLHAMERRLDIRLHGPATSLALRNLTEFQLAWSCWRPARYQPIAIEADAIVSPPPRAGRSLSAYSGGVDSTFTLLRNMRSSDTPRYGVDTVVLVHGFDVALANGEALQELIERTAPVRELAGVRLSIVRTNSKELGLQSWEDSCGAQLAACLHLFSSEYSHALIGGSDAYNELWLPWGTNPVTDHLLSGGQMTIVHDGAAFCRTGKLAWLASCPTALRTLKVCWQGRDQGRNCGACEKCVRTHINLLAAGISGAPCFDAPFDPGRIARLPIASDLALAELKSIVAYGERHQLDAGWFRALRQRVRKGVSPRKRRRTWRARVSRSLARVRLLEAARMMRSKLAFLAWG